MGQQYQPGAFDCLTFTNEAWRKMYGYGWADDWLGRYSAGGRFLGRKALIEQFGHDNLFGAIDQRLTRVSGHPPVCSLVAAPGRAIFGHALGIANGSRAAFFGPDGLAQFDIDIVEAAWVPLD